jgi:hypothetical protein
MAPQMIDRRDPEFPALRADATWRLDREYLAGTIGASTYLRSLFLLGVPNDDAQRSLRELNDIKGRCMTHEEQRLATSKQWMETYHER